MIDDLQRIQVPLDQFVREIAREAARMIIQEHAASCAIGSVTGRLLTLENRFSLLLGAILGSGALGGAAGALITKLLN